LDKLKKDTTFIYKKNSLLSQHILIIKSMKKILLFLFVFSFALVSNAQYKKDGTPDMRYKVNKQVYGSSSPSSSYNSVSSYSRSSSSSAYPRSSIYNKPRQNTYSSPYSASKPTSQRTYSNGGSIKLQNGYMKNNGSYVRPHLKTSPDNKTWNNLSNY
jgi:hypothetical protein